MLTMGPVKKAQTTTAVHRMHLLATAYAIISVIVYEAESAFFFMRF